MLNWFKKQFDEFRAINIASSGNQNSDHNGNHNGNHGQTTHSNGSADRAGASTLTDSMTSPQIRLQATVPMIPAESSTLTADATVMAEPTDEMPVVDSLNPAHQLLAAGEIEAAIAAYHQYLASHPTSVEAYQYLASAHQQQGKLAEAAAAYRQAIELMAGEDGGQEAADRGQEAETVEALDDAKPTPPPSPNLSTQFADAADYIEDAVAYAEEEQWDAAIAVSLEALKRLEPQLLKTYRGLVEALYTEGQMEEAIVYARRVVELVPDSASDRANLGSLYAQRQQWQEAVTCYEQAIALDSDLASAYWHLSKVWQRLENAEQSMLCAFQALQRQPDWADATGHLQLGNTLFSHSQFEAAAVCYRQAIQRDAGLVEAHFGLAEALLALGQSQNALSSYQQAVQLAPQSGTYALKQTQVLLALEHWQEAIAAYRHLITLEPTPAHYFKFGELLAKQNRWSEAIACYRTLTELQPDSWEAFHNLGGSLNHEQRWLEAIDAYRRAIALNPDYSWSHNNLGDALIHLERWSEAAEAFQKAIALHPDFHWSHYNLGECYSHLQQWDEAIQGYKRAIELEPETPYAHQKLGDTLRLRAKADQAAALDAYRTAIQRDPDEPKNYHGAIELEPDKTELYYGLGLALRRKGKYDEAQIFLQMVHQIESGTSQNTQKASHDEDISNSKSQTHENFSELTFPKKHLRKVLVSVLLFYALERTKNFLASVPQKILQVAERINVDVSFILRNHSPEPDNEIQGMLESLRAQYPNISFTYVKTHNLGFSSGHNANFKMLSSDVFIVINNDIALPNFDFLEDAITEFEENSNLAAIGAVGTPTHIQRDFAYVPDKQDSLLTKDYVEASLIFLKSEIFQAIGGFDDDYSYAYFEDADLSLRLKQAGYQVKHIEMPFQHFRSASSLTLPESTRSTIYEYNRARFLSKWSNYLKTRTLHRKILIRLTPDGIGDLVDCFYPVKALIEKQSSMLEIVLLTSKPSLNFLFNLLPVTIINGKSLPANAEDIFDQIYDINDLNFSPPFQTLDLIAAKLGIHEFSTDESVLRSIFLRNKKVFDLPDKYIVAHLDSQRAEFEGRAPILKACIPALERLLNESKVVLVGMNFPDDRKDSCFENFVENQPDVIDLRDLSSIEELFYVISNAELFFGVDSGPMHIAQLLNVPTFALFGPIHPGTKLYRVGNSGAAFNLDRESESGSYHRMVEPSYYFCMRRDEACIKGISSGQILAELREFLENEYKFNWNKLVAELRYRQREWLTLQFHNPLFKNRILTKQTFSNRTLSDLLINVCEVFENRASDVVNHYIDDAKEELTRLNDKMSELILQNRALQFKLAQFNSQNPPH